MKPHQSKLFIAMIACVMTLTQAKAQVTEGIVIGSKLLSAARSKGALKKIYKAQVPQWMLIKGDTLVYLRTPKEPLNEIGQFHAKYGGFIRGTAIVEYELEDMRKKAASNQSVYTEDRLKNELQEMEQKWPEAPVAVYREELKFYERYQQKLEEEKVQARKKAKEAAFAASMQRFTHPDVRGTVNVDGPGALITEEEYNTQDKTRNNSNHGHLVQLTGTKRAWINEVCRFVMARNWEPQSVQTEGNRTTFVYTGACSNCTEPPKLIIQQTFDSVTGNTKEVEVSGASNTVLGFYITYYGLEDMSAEDAAGKNFAHNFKGDRVTVTWKNKLPFVKISPNPDYQ